LDWLARERVATTGSAINAGSKTKKKKKKKQEKQKKNMKNYKTIIAAVALGLACSAVTSNAALVTLNPGGSALIGDTSYTVGGTLIAQLASPYTTPSGDVGTFSTAVYQNDPNNLLGGLTFVYTENLTAGFVGTMTVDGFNGTVAVGNVSGTPAQTASYTGNFLKFNWTPTGSDAPAPITTTFVVDTSSLWYGGNIGSVQDGTTANPPTLAPVPEPSTVVAGILMLLPFGIGAVRSLCKDRTA
jgi:hypothetical protein